MVDVEVGLEAAAKAEAAEIEIMMGEKALGVFVEVVEEEVEVVVVAAPSEVVEGVVEKVEAEEVVKLEAVAYTFLFHLHSTKIEVFQYASGQSGMSEGESTNASCLDLARNILLEESVEALRADT